MNKFCGNQVCDSVFEIVKEQYILKTIHIFLKKIAAMRFLLPRILCVVVFAENKEVGL